MQWINKMFANEHIDCWLLLLRKPYIKCRDVIDSPIVEILHSVRYSNPKTGSTLFLKLYVVKSEEIHLDSACLWGFYFPFQVFVTESYDATTHFETTCNDVVRIFEQATGQPFDCSKVKTQPEDDWTWSGWIPLQGSFLGLENLG